MFFSLKLVLLVLVKLEEQDLCHTKDMLSLHYSSSFNSKSGHVIFLGHAALKFLGRQFQHPQSSK